MIKNYLKIAIRNLKRHKAYAFINVFGLALSMACGILIFTLVNYHLSFDNFHTDSDRIYRVVTEQHRDKISYTNAVPTPLGKVFRNDYSYGEKVARVAAFNDQLISFKKGSENKKFQEPDGVSFVEPEFFDIFNYPLAEGNKQLVLVEPNTAIVTEKIAKKYFGNDNPLNQVIRVDNRVDFKITGVLKDLPENTDRRSEIFLSYATLKAYNDWLGSDGAWGGINSGMECYIKLLPNIKPYQAEIALQTYVKKFRPNSKNIHHYRLQPLSDMHFNAQYGGPMEKRNLWILTFIALFLIITACINFINLATAQAMNRSKEIGIRKVLGSLRGQLFWQFITETFFITLTAAIVAIGLSILALPFMNDWFQAHMRINPVTNPTLLIFITGLIVLVTFFAGSYPGLILSGFRPIMALKSKVTQSHIGGLNTRRSLIVAQFAISQVLIIGMIVIGIQMRYSKQSDMGFTKEAIVMIPVATGSTALSSNTLKNRFAEIPGVEKVSLCFSPPASSSNWSTSMRYENNAEDEAFRVNMKSADEDYLSTFELQLVAGRNLLHSDTSKEYLANELLAEKLNLKSPQELIGKSIMINGVKAPIVGVIKNFHDQSFHQDITPLCITSSNEQYNSYAVKINMAKAKTILAAIDKTWSETHPDQIYSYQFVDDHIARFYETEDLMLKLIQAFSLIAILIGCFGLYGLVSFIAAQKTKEIGIRKVLGGTIMHILWMFGKEFSKLILIAFVLAAPIAWWLMNNWLQDFKFRINISVWIFIGTILITTLITGLTVGYQSIKSSLANPVKSLRTE
jgi:putative ABC transport system permease protein